MNPTDDLFNVFYNKRAIMSHPDFYGYEKILDEKLESNKMYNLHEAYNIVTAELLQKKA